MDTTIALEKQEAFNKVWDHLITKKAKPSYNNGLCCYRQSKTATDPVRCAVGVLIPDEEYTAEFEYGVPLDEIQQKILALKNLDHGFFLRSLQLPHDRACKYTEEARLEYYEHAYRSIAESYGLTVPND